MPENKTQTKSLKVKTQKLKGNVEVQKTQKPVKVAQKSGISVSVFDISGKETGKIELPKEVFGQKENPSLIAQAVRVYLANQRKGTASTKTRSEVAGTTKKMYRQKGTGRARHGAAKAPIFVGGGIAFGPKPRDFSLSLPKKMKKKALASALSAKLTEGNVMVVDWENAIGKTKQIAQALKNMKLLGKSMIVIGSENENVKKASANISSMTVVNSSNVTTYDVVKNRNVLFVKNTIDVITKTFSKENKA